MSSPELTEESVVAKGYFMNSHVYDILKKMVQIILPAFGVFYISIGAAWDLPGTKQVSDTIIALCTFIGVLLTLSSRSYNKSDAQYDGALDITQNEDGSKVYSLNLNTDTSVLDSKRNVNFKVDNK